MDPNIAVGCLAFVLRYLYFPISYLLIAFLCAGSLDPRAGDRSAATAQSLSEFAIFVDLGFHDDGVASGFQGMSGQCAYDLQQKPVCFLRFLFDLPGISLSATYLNYPNFETDDSWMCVVTAWWLRSVQRERFSGATFSAELYYLHHLRSCAACSSGSQGSGVSSPTGSVTCLGGFFRRLRRARDFFQQAVSATSAVLVNIGSWLGSGIRVCCLAAAAFVTATILYRRISRWWFIFFAERFGCLCSGARPLVRVLQYVFFLYMGATSASFFPWMLALVSLQLMWCQVPGSDLSQLAGFGQCKVQLHGYAPLK